MTPTRSEMSYCPICRHDTANRLSLGAGRRGFEHRYCPACMGCFSRYTWRRLELALHARRPWARRWLAWRIPGRIARVRIVLDRILHPMARRHLPGDLKGETIADALRELAWRGEELERIGRERLYYMKRSEAAESEARLARIQLTLHKVPAFRRIVESLGLREETIQ